MKYYRCHSECETIALGHDIGKNLPDHKIVCFFGDLGVGKTTLIKGLAASIANISPEKINSPTFVYLNIYSGAKSVYHFDLYRLRDEEEFLSRGFDEFLYAGAACCIEWSEKISSLLPSKDCIRIEMEYMNESERLIKIEM